MGAGRVPDVRPPRLPVHLAMHHLQNPENPNTVYPSNMQGVLWVLDMYLTSDCPDYRFTYEREAPLAAALVEATAKQSAIRRKRLSQVLFSRLASTS